VELAQQAEDAAAEVEIDGIGFQRARRLIRDMLEDQGIAAQLDLVVKELMALDV